MNPKSTPGDDALKWSGCKKKTMINGNLFLGKQFIPYNVPFLVNKNSTREVKIDVKSVGN